MISELSTCYYVVICLSSDQVRCQTMCFPTTMCQRSNRNMMPTISEELYRAPVMHVQALATELIISSTFVTEHFSSIVTPTTQIIQKLQIVHIIPSIPTLITDHYLFCTNFFFLTTTMKITRFTPHHQFQWRSRGLTTWPANTTTPLTSSMRKKAKG